MTKEYDKIVHGKIVLNDTVIDSTVHHPSHYNRGKIEVIDFINDQGLNFSLGNVIKYCCRFEGKDGIKDLKKARWYLDNEIIRRIKEENNSDR